MAFDVAGAREAGYSDLEIANHLSRGADFDVQGAINAGYSPLEIINHLNPEEETTVLGATGEFLKGIPRGFASSFATAGQGLTELTDAGLNLVGLEDAITDEDTEAVAGYVQSFQNALREGPLGADPAYSDAFATKFGEGLGSFASFLVPGGALKVAGKLGKMSKIEQAATSSLAASPLAIGAGTGDQAQRVQAARDQGIEISQEVEDMSIGLGGLIGLSELAPLARILKAIPKSQLSGIIPRIESAVKTGGLEAVQELSAGLAQDFTERGMYNPDLEVGQSAWDDLTIGGAVGATADLLVNYAAGRKAKSAEQLRQEAELEEETLRREGQEGFEAGIRAEETAKKERAEEVDRILEETRQEARESIDRTPLEIAIDYRQDNGKDISRAELEFNAGPLEDSVYNEILNQAREAETVTPILALPSPDQRKLAAQEAVQERMKKLGLSESVQTKVVDVIRKVRTDEQGNLIFEADATVEDSDSFGSYMPTAKVIQLSIDQVFADAKGQPVTEEMVVDSLTKTLNHEIYHAIRNLDLVTQEEVELLEGLARKYRKKGTEGADGQPLTYASWAEQGYSDLNSAKITEEAVAELISDALAGNVIADGQTITIGGKPRNIIQRIVDFFKSMVGFTSSAKARNFSDFLGKLDSGEVGARERGEIRTPYLTDYARAEKMKRGVGKQRLPDQPIAQLGEEYAESRRAEDSIAAPDKGINVRTDNETNYAELIVSGQKQYESRDTDSLRPYVGKRVGIIETGSGPAKLVGYATVGEPVEVGETEFAGSREQHLVPEGSRFDIKPGQTKFLYEMIEPEPLSQPVDVSSSRGIVARNIAGFDKPSESRRVERVNASVVPIFKGEEAPPKMKGKTQVAQFLETRAKDSIGKVRDIALEEDRDAIAEDLAEEAAYEMEKQGNALEWYDDTISKTLELLSEKHPEIKKDPNAKTPFLASLAITSQNMSVPENLRYAEQVYNEYKLTGRFPEVGFGEKGGSMKANFIKANKLLDRLGSVQEVEKFLQTKFKVSELNKVTKDFLGQKAETGELADTEVFGSAIFGPKIGNGFYTNLRGDFSPVTMDMWFMRTMGRLSGRLMDLDRDRFDAQLDRLAKAEGMEQASEAELIDRAKQLKSQHEKDFKNFRDEYDAGIRKQSESTLAAKNIVKSVTGTRDVPANGTERKHLRDITMRAIEKLEAKTGQKIEPAAFQALIWYPEQDLYKNLGVNLRHVRQDYATSTEQLLLEEGYDPRKLKRAKDRVRERAKRRARGLRPDAGAVEQRADRLRAGQLDSVVPEEATARRKLTTRKHPPAKVEEAVIKDEILAEDMQGFPRVNFQAEPDAQYVAQDPDAGYEPQFDESQLASRRTPDRSRSYEESIDAVLGDRPVGPTQYETYQEATGEGKLDYWLTKFKQGAINRFARLEALNRDPALRDNLADSSSIAAALFADRSRGVVSAAIKYGVPVYRNGITKVEDFSHNGVQYRGLIDLMSKLYSEEHGDLTKDAQAYAIAKRGERLESKSGKPAPLSKEQREEIILNAEQYIDDNGRKIIEDWYNAWQAYNNYTIRFLKDTGVLNNETAALWEKYSDYVPFYRAAAGEGNAPAIAQQVFGGDLTAKAHIKEYKGSKDKIDVPLTEAIGLNLTAAIEMGMRNVAQQRIIRDMQTIGLAKQLKKGEAATADLVTLKVNGKEVRFDVYDPLVFESMQSLPDQGFLVNNVFGAPARFLREMITRDPGFMMVNMLRDTLSTFTTSGSNFVPVVDTLRGYADGMDTLERTGVVGGYDYSNDPDNVVKFYQKEMKRRGIGPEGGRGSPLGMFTSIWDALGNATTRSDAATRNAVYKDVLARTGNEAEANFQALEVINFSRRGANALARVLTATIPFLNARFQGLDVFYRAGKGEYTANKELSRRQAIQSFVTRAGMLTALTALYYTLVSDDDQYKEQSEEIRDNNWIIPTASGVPVKIPIPFEVGLVFKTIPETILAATIGDKSSKEARETIQRGIVSTLEINPLGVQAISPLVEASMNHSFYTGRDIVPYYIDANVATGLQDRVSTTEIGKFIGSELGISPIKVDHVMTGYGGTLGGYVLSAVDAILRSEAVTGDEAAKMPALKIYEYPVIKRFFASEQGSGLRQDAYELYREINKVVTTSNKLKKEGRLEELNSYLSSKQHLLDLKSPVYNIKGKLDQSRRSRDAIMRMDIDPERKREMIDDIDENINEMLKVIPALKKRADLPAFESGLARRITGG